MTDTTTTEEFRKRLFALCSEFNVEMEVEEDCSGWDGCQTTGVNFFSYDEWDDCANVTRPGVNLTLSVYEDFQDA